MKQLLAVLAIVTALLAAPVPVIAADGDNDGATPIWSTQEGLPDWAAKAFSTDDGE